MEGQRTLLFHKKFVAYGIEIARGIELFQEKNFSFSVHERFSQTTEINVIIFPYL